MQSDIEQRIGAELNQRFNKIIQPGVMVGGAASPVVILGTLDALEPVWNFDQRVETTVAGPAAGATIVETPALPESDFDFWVNLTTTIQATARNINLNLSVTGTVQLFRWDNPNEGMNLTWRFALRVPAGDTLRIQNNSFIGTGNYTGTIWWRPRMLVTT